MPSQARDSRAEERRLSIRTLAIASASSAIAAIVSSRLWTAGTPIAAATTPVVVTLVSEMLQRPTAKIAERMTVETQVLPQAMGAGAPPRDGERDEADPVREQPLGADDEGPGTRSRGASTSGQAPGGMRVYRSGAGRRALPWKLIAATGALAFVIGIAVLSLPQLIAGESLLKGNPPGFASATGKKKDKSDNDKDRQTADPEEQQDPARPGSENTSTTEEETDPESQPEVAPQSEEEPPADTTTPETTTAPVPEQ